MGDCPGGIPVRCQYIGVDSPVYAEWGNLRNSVKRYWSHWRRRVSYPTPLLKHLHLLFTNQKSKLNSGREECYSLYYGRIDVVFSPHAGNNGPSSYPIWMYNLLPVLKTNRSTTRLDTVLRSLNVAEGSLLGGALFSTNGALLKGTDLEEHNRLLCPFPGKIPSISSRKNFPKLNPNLRARKTLNKFGDRCPFGIQAALDVLTNTRLSKQSWQLNKSPWPCWERRETLYWPPTRNRTLAGEPDMAKSPSRSWSMRAQPRMRAPLHSRSWIGAVCSRLGIPLLHRRYCTPGGWA